MSYAVYVVYGIRSIHGRYLRIRSPHHVPSNGTVEVNKALLLKIYARKGVKT